MIIDVYQVSAKLADPSDENKAYLCFTDSKIYADWLETHVFISKYCLQISKYNDLECCQPMRTNMLEVMCVKFPREPTILALSSGKYFINQSKKSETQKMCEFYESLALQQLQPGGYKKCMKLPYDLYCSSTTAKSAEYVCPNARYKKICTTKELLKFYLQVS